MKTGDKVILWYCSANRDESVIPEAEMFQIDRSGVRNHAAFGFGIHRCMGNRLAEMQLRVLWEEILQNRRDRARWCDSVHGLELHVFLQNLSGYTWHSEALPPSIWAWTCRPRQFSFDTEFTLRTSNPSLR